MSPGAVKWAYDQHVGKNKFLLVTLAMYADGFGVCRIPLTDLAGLIDRDESTVTRQLRQLVEGGFAERIEQAAANGVQLVSITKLCLSAKYAEERKPHKAAEMYPRNFQGYPRILQGGTEKTPQNEPLQIAGVPPQNAGHKEKDSSSLVPNNNHLTGAREDHQRHLLTIRDAGLSSVWSSWVRHLGAAQTTQEAQSPHWAKWIQDGLKAVLAEGVEQTIAGGASINNPWRFLSGLMKKQAQERQTANSAQTTQDSSAAVRAAFEAGRRVRLPNGDEATIISTGSSCIYTDHAVFETVPLAQLKNCEVLA